MKNKSIQKYRKCKHDSNWKVLKRNIERGIFINNTAKIKKKGKLLYIGKYYIITFFTTGVCMEGDFADVK